MADASKRTPRPVPWLIGLGLVLTVAVVGLALGLAWLRSGPGAAAPLPVLFPIPDFTLTNQDGRTVSRADLGGTVWVADIIFTRCAGPCPKMTQRMSELQGTLPAPDAVKLVTLTTDADYDTPPVLRRYGERFGAQPGRWLFLTGNQRQLANLAIDGFKFVAVAKPPEERTDAADLFVHSTQFVLVDQRGRARAVYQYDEPGMRQRLQQDVRILLGEP